MRKMFVLLAALSIAANGIGVLKPAPASAAPTRCMNDGVAYADGRSGSTNRWSSDEWYAAYYEYLDENCTDNGDYPPSGPPTYCYWIGGMYFCSS